MDAGKGASVASFPGPPLAHPSGTLQGTALVGFELVALHHSWGRRRGGMSTVTRMTLIPSYPTVLLSPFPGARRLL